MVFSFLVAGERRWAGGCSLAGRCAKGHWPFSVFVWANVPRRTLFPNSLLSCCVGAALVGLRTCPGDRSPRLRGPARRLSTYAPSPCSLARPGIGVASTPRVAGRLAPKAPAVPALGFNPRPLRGGGYCVWCPTPTSNPRRCFNPCPRTGRLPQIRSTTSTPLGRSPVSTCTA